MFNKVKLFSHIIKSTQNWFSVTLGHPSGNTEFKTRFRNGREEKIIIHFAPNKIISDAKRVYRKHGLIYTINAVRRNVWAVCTRFFRSIRCFFWPGRFKLNDIYFEYSCHPDIWRNERRVEVPIALAVVKEAQIKGLNILEVGNVLWRYGGSGYDVLDKYEVQKGIINEDIVSYIPKKKYDIIISVSTFEHVGWDENEYGGKSSNGQGKLLLGIDNLIKNCLVDRGEIFFTVPIGYNPQLNLYIETNKLNTYSCRFLLRKSFNRWCEASWDEVKNVKFNFPFPFANAILIGRIKKQETN